jgi:MobA/MobL family
MAIYHFSAQVISRGKGQSAIASASYRSGERLKDERTGEVKYYHREVQPDTMILAPSNAPEWVYDRERLWNEVEHSEKRKDARLAREINIALPRELNHHEQKELIRDYVQEAFVNQGMIADIAIHRDDPNNPHAHVMLTTREITADGFGPKNRDWNKKEMLEGWREEWANHANRALERAGIKERISHLSHEARGLEILPTIHLGHVAHEMEKRGIQTERGNINREREAYNRLVVDLQKYREEKQALEQANVRQQEEKQKVEQFNTPEERVHLKEASKVLKASPTLKSIAERREQLDKWEKRLDHNSQYIRWKDEAIQKASQHYDWIHTFENKIQQAEQRIKNINWLNPLKMKENRMVKEKAEHDIASAKSDIAFHQEKLQYYKEKLGFHTETEFTQLKKQYEVERPGLLEKNNQSRKRIRYERDVLQKAQKALQNRFVRQLASNYPNRPEMRYMSFQTALKLHKVNQSNNRMVPIEDIEKLWNKGKQRIQEFEDTINQINRRQLSLQRAEEYLKHYEKYQAIVEKYEQNPFLKGKMLVSKSTKQEYEEAVIARDHYQDLLKREGFSGRDDFEQQKKDFNRLESKVPEFKEQIESIENAIGLLDGIVKGIEQAQREMNREQKRQQQKVRGKHQVRSLENPWEMER